MKLIIWEKLLLIDAQSLLSILFWESCSSIFIIVALRIYSTYVSDRRLLVGAIIQRSLCSAAYLLVLMRGSLPDLISSTLGNVLLFSGFYLENLITLSLMKLLKRQTIIFSTVSLGLCCIAYTLLDIIYPNPNVRVAMASLTIFLMFVPITWRGILSKESNTVNRIACITYLLVILATLPRFATAVLDSSYSLYTTDIFQTRFYVLLLLKSSFGTLLFLFYIKIDADKKITALGVDYLTGLLNRRTYHELGNEMLTLCRKHERLLCIIFLDIDSFKNINDTYGHAKGDEVLIAFGHALNRSLHTSDLCCRYGGDEFSICSEIPSIEISKKIAQNVLQEISRINIIPDCTITSSIGIACGIPGETSTFEEYLEKADAAMYTAKQNGKNQIHFSKI